ncbi:hypothetical protein Cgig2_026609 [Carnegiea gigantea]|uniref:HMA domain-containing protein n=1 Tax=Carnegiea gigantea TaxID=171969 RepID=A0A9Q1QLG7_9CARY|nr:hypothetical protein Cgig2_026609 [Carnegiea gigantea]
MEENKNPESEKKPEEEKKSPESNKKDKQDNPPPEGGGEEKKPDEPPPPPPPPPEIVLRVYMHCEGCARKVRRCLKGFDGVEEVVTDCKTHKVVVKGEKADPLKVLDRVQRKTHRQVELLSPIPKPPAPEENKDEQKEPPKTEDKKEEPKVVTVVLKVHMHCDACSLEIKKRIEKMQEVEEATPDLKNSQVTVKGTFDPAKLVKYVNKRTGKHAIIVKQDPSPETKEDEKGKDGKEEKKGEGEGEEGKGKGEEKGGEEGKADKPEGTGDGRKEADDDADAGAAPPGEEAAKVELKRNEYYYYPPSYAMEMYAYPPQIFSDENPNACSVM